MTAEDRTFGLGGAKEVERDPLTTPEAVVKDPLSTPEERTQSLQGAAEVTRDPLLGPEERELGDSYTPPAGSLNVIEFLLDDVGIDGLELYDAVNQWEPVLGAGVYPYPDTPNIDAVAATGVTFTNAYAHPVCSPDRAAALTGRVNVLSDADTEGTGIGWAVNLDDPNPLTAEMLPLPVAHAAEGTDYQHIHVGKWHLGDGQDAGLALDSPGSPIGAGGNDHYRGCLTNPNKNMSNVGDSYVGDYTDWTLTVATSSSVAQASHTSGHILAREVSDALALMPGDGTPFVMRVWFHFAHSPFDVVPDTLLAATATMRGAEQEPNATSNPYNNRNVVWRRWKAMIEATDKAIGDILDGLSSAQRANTVVIIRADNGSDDTALTPVGSPVEPPVVYDEEHAKHTVYEQGIKVPLVIGAHPATASPAWIGTPGSTSTALAQTVDVWATIAEATLANWQTYQTDGVSLLGLLGDLNSAPRAYASSFAFRPNGSTWSEADAGTARAAVRDVDGYKLIRRDTGSDEMYYLPTDPLETSNLYPPATSPLQLKYLELSEQINRYTLGVLEPTPLP